MNPSSAQGGEGYVAAPGDLFGTRDYYLFRAANAPSSYRNGSGSDYYLEYGLKYFDRFAKLRDRLGEGDQRLITFIDEAKVELQIALETRLAADPSLGANRNLLMLAAFDSHSDAYLKAGFADLTYGDKLTVFGTVWDGLGAAGVGPGLKELWDTKAALLPTLGDMPTPIITGFPDW